MALRRFGIDLSPDQVVVWGRGEGLVIEEPAVLAQERATGRALAVGIEALELGASRSDEIRTVWPLGLETLADPKAAEQLLRHLIFRVVGRLLFSRHELMLGVPAELQTDSRRVLLHVAMASGARMAHMMDLPLAAALGAGLPVAAWTPLPLGLLLPQVAQVAVVCHEGLLCHDACPAPAGGWEGDAGLELLADLLNSQIGDLPPRLRAEAVHSGLALGGRGVALARVGVELDHRTPLRARVLADPSHCVAKGTEVALARIESLGSEGLLYLR
ncbi:MAG: rod shape-determining protein [Candidatus Dormibacteria bacterium]